VYAAPELNVRGSKAEQLKSCNRSCPREEGLFMICLRQMPRFDLTPISLAGRRKSMNQASLTMKQKT
jgi:hypothetical protein